MFYRYNIILTFLLCGLLGISAQSGTSAYRMLDLPVSSRMAALGGKNVSSPDGDLNFAFLNPALLNGASNSMLSLNMANYLADIQFGTAAYGFSKGRHHFAAGVQFLDYGTFKEATESNEIIGEFTAKDIALSLIYSQELSERISVGVTLKPVFSAYERYTSFGAAFDMGLHYRSVSGLFSAGMALRNLGAQLKGYYLGADGQHTERLPLDLQLGFTQKLAHAPFRLSLTLHQLNRWNLYYTDNSSGKTDYDYIEMAGSISVADMAFRHAIVGVEFLPGKNFYLAASYNHRRHQELVMNGFRSMAGFSFGGGVRISKFQVGFGVSQFQVGNSSYLFSVSTSLNEFKL
ncbi:MAG: hypothetical protein BGP01_14175 [Paludibacter sp. 47-17]|nr:MAG: hypothetical protein ABS72_04800 [Paludibacter sp. SCN 50-10]OJX87818.1 MAG: hypothetical protein BGP01_14175 [Paludibacter sp. 47-17]